MTEVLGMDISKHQNDIDWDKVKAEGKVKFVMIRLGFGGDYTSQDDVTFEENVKEAERVGIPWGAYIYSYALNLTDAESEKNHVLRLLKGKSPSYPIGFDMEDADGYKAKHGMPSNQMLVDICERVLLGIEQAGFYAVLYASKSWLDNQLNNAKLDRFDKWVAQWGSACTYNKPFGLWQFTNSGTVSGVSGRVDMNKAFKDYPSIIAKKSAPVVSKPAEQPSKPAPEVIKRPNQYTVQSGDNLSKIAAKFGMTIAEIVKLNGISNPNLIRTGQVLKLVKSQTSQSKPVQKPVSRAAQYHVIQAGETLSEIAAHYGTAEKTIQTWNGISNPNLIFAGKRIRVK
jgi:LysM repeat protein